LDSLERKVILSIAGYDPSGGAGVIADCKTIENCGGYGIGVLTSITSQSTTSFHDLVWLDSERIKSQLEPLLDSFKIKAVKIGLTKGPEMLKSITSLIQEKLPSVPVLWDPVMKSSTGFDFFSEQDATELLSLLTGVDYLTPNISEAYYLSGQNQPEEAARVLTAHCSGVITGICEDESTVKDLVFENTNVSALTGENISSSKHGSGCVYSSSLVSALVNGKSLTEAALFASSYTKDFLLSSQSQIGFHQVKV